MAEEKKDVQGKLEAAEGALSSSEADRERLKLDLKANESAVEGLRGEIDETRLECEQLHKVRVCCYSCVLPTLQCPFYLASSRCRCIYIFSIATQMPARIAAHACNHRGQPNQTKPPATPPALIRSFIPLFLRRWSG